MDVKLYVGNLSYDTTEEDLRSLFSTAGTVSSVALIMDRATGRSKGFAFVEMSSQSEAEQAIKTLDGTSLGNREIKVNKARPPEERSSSGFGDRSGGFKDRNRRSGGGRNPALLIYSVDRVLLRLALGKTLSNLHRSQFINIAPSGFPLLAKNFPRCKQAATWIYGLILQPGCDNDIQTRRSRGSPKLRSGGDCDD